MKIQKHKRSHGRRVQRLTVLTVVSVSSLLLIAVLYVFLFNGALFGWKFRTTHEVTSAPQTTQTNTGEKTSQDTKTTANSTPSQTTNQIPVNGGLTVTIDQLEQTNGEVVFVGSSNSGDKGGTCSITFTNPNDRPVSRSVTAEINGTRSICGPVQIPDTEFSFVGEWKATFRYYVNETQAVAEKNLTIQ